MFLWKFNLEIWINGKLDSVGNYPDLRSEYMDSRFSILDVLKNVEALQIQ
jgi:hypothetical protein